MLCRKSATKNTRNEDQKQKADVNRCKDEKLLPEYSPVGPLISEEDDEPEGSFLSNLFLNFPFLFFGVGVVDLCSASNSFC